MSYTLQAMVRVYTSVDSWVSVSPLVMKFTHCGLGLELFVVRLIGSGLMVWYPVSNRILKTFRQEFSHQHTLMLSTIDNTRALR